MGIEVLSDNGPSLHKHSMEYEVVFYVLEGEFSFLYGDKESKVADKGQFINHQEMSFMHIKILENQLENYF